jgi:protein MAK16
VAYRPRLTHACSFCRKFSVAGVCTRRLCPLSNSDYATVLEGRSGNRNSRVSRFSFSFRDFSRLAVYPGRRYLLVKTAERANYPRRMWERCLLSNSFSRGYPLGSSYSPTVLIVAALRQIDEKLPYWPRLLVSRCKARLTRLMQIQIRARHFALRDTR